jgi:hypothetical protein
MELHHQAAPTGIVELELILGRRLKLAHEDIADWDYRPHACAREYRLIIVRKNISRE